MRRRSACLREVPQRPHSGRQRRKSRLRQMKKRRLRLEAAYDAARIRALRERFGYGAQAEAILRAACGNFAALAELLEDPAYPAPLKLALLQTLGEKDLARCPARRSARGAGRGRRRFAVGRIFHAISSLPAHRDRTAVLLAKDAGGQLPGGAEAGISRSAGRALALDPGIDPAGAADGIPAARDAARRGNAPALRGSAVPAAVVRCGLPHARHPGAAEPCRRRGGVCA